MIIIYRSQKITRAKGIAHGGTIVHCCRISCFGDVDLSDPHTGGGVLWKFVSSGGESNSKWPLADTCGFSWSAKFAVRSAYGGT